MPVVGTAGHVDHGKSTLVEALSGRDPDRWAIEKERGLTIDLGFAWTTLDDGTEVSFVDVPGHERYSKNMLAGIEAIDVALFVVAADEGWMPQSEEHLAVLDLLGVRHGVVALAKVDRVDSDLVGLAALEVEERLVGTSLEGSPIVRVSATHGTGLPELRRRLTEVVSSLVRVPSDRPRLWVDRVFSAAGAGTVVTGTLLGGALAVDDRVAIFPRGISARIRGIQSHEAGRERVEPHRRVALNLAGVSVDDVTRGSMVGREDEWRTTRRVAVELRAARYVEDLTERGAYHMHVGSGAWPAHVRSLGERTALLDLPAALPLTMGDRFILRDTGRRIVAAGGRVLDPSPGSGRRLSEHLASLHHVLDADPDTKAAALLEVRGRDLATNLSMDSGGGGVAGAFTAGGFAMTAATVERALGELTRAVERFHTDHPLRPGLPVAEAASRLRVGPDAVVAFANQSPSLVADGAYLRATGFAGTRSDAQEEAWDRARARLEEAGPAAAPRVGELGLDPELLHALARDGALVRISEEFALLPAHVDALLGEIRSFATPFTVSEFKDRTGLSRKYAVPFLEWADAAGHTVRMGDTRRAR